MAADFSPLDTSQRAKVLAVVNQLADAGLSDADIARYFQAAQQAGQQSLQDYYNSAGLAIGQQFAPQFEMAQNRLGASPLLADSGYANRLNRQLQSDLYARLAGQYGQAASEMSGQNVNFLRGLYGQRAGLRGALAQSAYGTILQSPRKKKFGEKLLGLGGQLLGAGIGGFTGGLGGGGGGGGWNPSDYYTAVAQGPTPRTYTTKSLYGA